MHNLDKIDPQFRILADQLFFTDRTDLDTSNFLILLGNKDEHYRYLWDRLVRSAEIFWEESFWVNRFDFLLRLNPRKLVDELESYLLVRFRNLIISNPNASPKYDNQYIQFVAWTKVKSQRKENLMNIQEFFVKLPHTIQSSRLIGIIENFTPHLIQSTDEYIDMLSKKIAQSARNFEVLQQLEKQGSKIEKAPLFKLATDLLSKRVPNRKNRRSFFAMLNDPAIITHLKSEYKKEHQARLVNLIKNCDYREIEESHLRNIKNLLELDVSIADELMTTYANRLYSRGTGNKKANVMRLIRLCKVYPQFSPKKVLAYLSSNGKMSDIKHLISAFPELKTLVPFV